MLYVTSVLSSHQGQNRSNFSLLTQSCNFQESGRPHCLELGIDEAWGIICQRSCYPHSELWRFVTNLLQQSKRSGFVGDMVNGDPLGAAGGRLTPASPRLGVTRSWYR